MKTLRSINIKEVKSLNEPTLKTGNKKFDDWFSKDGGMVVPSAIFLTGSSGAGKTTLMINLMKWLGDVKTSIYLREMSKESTKEQTKSIIFDHDNAFVSDEKTCPTFKEYLEELDILKPKVVIIDSLQVIAKEDYRDVSEDKACDEISSILRKWIEKNHAVLILIGQVTKDDTFAGKNSIMHYMDGHIEMLFHKKENYRTISWGQKNRKGPMGTLYYVFGKDGIEFYTETEWKIKRNERRNFIETIVNSIQGYLDTMDSENVNYKLLKEEYNKEFKEIYNEYSATKNNVLYVTKLIKLTSRLSSEFKL